MKEYIEREAVIEAIKNHKCKSKVVYSIAEVVYCVGQEIGEAIRSVPVADVVEVVRCKDCEDSRPLKRERLPESIFRKECVWCRRFNTGMLPDGYCDHGKRKEEWPCP